MGDRLFANSRGTIRMWPIVALRIYTGVFFAYAGVGKLSHDNFANGVGRFLKSRLDESFDFYRPLVEAYFLPGKEVIAFLVAWGELAMGVALVLGLATRYAAFAGAFMVMNFWFAKGEPMLAGSNHDALWMVILLVLGLVPAGRIMGLDNVLSDRFRFLR